MAFIIAEAGVNHQGDVRLAFDLVDAAKDAGADAVKFQMFDAEKLEPPGPRRDMLAGLQLDRKAFRVLKTYVDDAGIEFMATPFDTESLRFLANLGCKKVKIGSADFGNRKLIDIAHRLFETVIISTGMADRPDIQVMNVSVPASTVLMHCTSTYPCPIEAVNLKCVLELYRDNFGLSDHTLSTVIPAAAVAMGATYIEKHLTLDRGMEGPDHKASLEPHEFAEMVRNIREVEAALGDGIKRPMPCEAETMKIREEREAWRIGQNAS